MSRLNVVDKFTVCSKSNQEKKKKKKKNWCQQWQVLAMIKRCYKNRFCETEKMYAAWQQQLCCLVVSDAIVWSSTFENRERKYSSYLSVHLFICSMCHSWKMVLAVTKFTIKFFSAFLHGRSVHRATAKGNGRASIVWFFCRSFRDSRFVPILYTTLLLGNIIVNLFLVYFFFFCDFSYITGRSITRHIHVSIVNSSSFLSFN